MSVVQIATSPHYFCVILLQKVIFVKDSKVGFIRDHCCKLGTTAAGFYSEGGWRLHSGLNIAWASRNLWPGRVVWGSVDGRWLRRNPNGKGLGGSWLDWPNRIVAKDRPGWSDITWGMLVDWEPDVITKTRIYKDMAQVGLKGGSGAWLKFGQATNVGQYQGIS